MSLLFKFFGSGAIKAGLAVGAVVFVLGYTYRIGASHERKKWIEKQLIETVSQQKMDIAARDQALASINESANAAALNRARRGVETKQLKATIEKLKNTPNPCRLDDATRQLLNDYASSKAVADPDTDNH